MSDVTMKDLGGVFAGSLIPSALLETLLASGRLSLAEVRETVQKAQDAVGHPPSGAMEVEAATILNWMLEMRFAANSVRK
ncbi:hypothetical protein [Bradyrhizobium sp. LMTR 3]|uniref:hypothetical protein n=1 Tax=Bradyrhizobium sp. LMTR 3 TaxID=189873 RepID=UPI0011471DF4|nr:hypothetical protein [Bradyrhizobium sp. LMTR 3]